MRLSRSFALPEMAHLETGKSPGQGDSFDVKESPCFVMFIPVMHFRAANLDLLTLQKVNG